MAFKHILLFSLQACFIQVAFSQCAAGFGPQGITGAQVPPGVNQAGPNLASLQNPGYGNNYGAFGQGYPGWGGSGSGDVAVAGELPVAGNTMLTGQVPVIGGVQFGGTLPASGIVTITGTCSCSPYGY